MKNSFQVGDSVIMQDTSFNKGHTYIGKKAKIICIYTGKNGGTFFNVVWEGTNYASNTWCVERFIKSYNDQNIICKNKR